MFTVLEFNSSSVARRRQNALSNYESFYDAKKNRIDFLFRKWNLDFRFPSEIKKFLKIQFS